MSNTAAQYEEEIQQAETLLAEGNRDDALEKYRNVMSGNPPEYHMWVNYSSFLHRCGLFEEAAAMAAKSNEIQPSPEGFHNLASALKQLGQIDEAIETYKKALYYNPEFMHAHNDLSVCYSYKQDFERAIDHMQIVTTAQPDVIQNWAELARLRTRAGRYYEALSACRQAHKLDPEDITTLAMFARLFSFFFEFEGSPQLVDNLTACLKSIHTDPNMLKGAIYNLYLKQPIIKTLVEQVDDYRFTNFDALLADPSLNWIILNHPLFLEMMRKIESSNLDLEYIYTALRYHMLDFTLEGKLDKLPWENPLSFVSALACQCFFNEYVYYETDDEEAMIAKLEDRIKTADAPDPHDIAIYACYRPLHEVENITTIINKVKTDNPDFAELVTTQVTEPLEEEKIKADLPKLTSIDDEISQLVKQQYEEHPYPRWTQVTSLPPTSFREFMLHSKPFLTGEDFNHIDSLAPSVLIAGCGTGKQIAYMYHAHHFSDVTAIDISASSLAYAKRKIEERGIPNITFGIADILKLPELNKQFDVIGCTGVLHHMDDPVKGLQSLYDCLKPGGFMQLALYSDIARAHVIAARDLIEERGYSHDTKGIRECREYIKTLPQDHVIAPAMMSIDFYTTSMCRDLIFHFQEHRYTCLQLKEMLNDMGLKFHGFYFSTLAPLQEYAAAYPADPHGLNLDNWHEFEKANPRFFREMYQFWVQKPAD